MKNLRPQVFLAIVTAAALAPFLNKAFHIDDPLFVWIAQQITRHPLDPYGFRVNWVSFTQPMSDVMQNPPLCSYYIAMSAGVFGWSEPALHLVFLIWAILAVLGTFALARRFCRDSLSAALLTLFTPVFLISATAVMCDVMMLSLWIWALELWFAGLDRQQWWHFFVSALLISAAALTKYFAIVLIPLLAVYTIARTRRFSLQLAYLLIPLAVMSNYDFVTEQKYGRGLFSAAPLVSSLISSATRPSRLNELLFGLAFTGGCFFSAALFLPLNRKGLLLAGLTSLVAFAAAFKLWIAPWIYLETSQFPVWFEGGVFAAIGLGILVLAFADFFRQKNANSLLLLLWVVGTFCFATFLNWSITARTLLPMAPAIAILMIRQVERAENPSGWRYFRIGVAATLSCLIALADYREADCARIASRLLEKRFQPEAGRVWFRGHWGFQYYMQQWGAKAVDTPISRLNVGDLLIVPYNNVDMLQVPPEHAAARDRLVLKPLPFISVSGLGSGAGFYSNFHGPLPWIINEVPAKRFDLVRIR